MRDTVEKRDLIPTGIPSEALTVDPKKLELRGKAVFGKANNKQNAQDDNRTIQLRKAHWQEYSEEHWGDKDRVPLVDFLRHHGTVEANKTHTRKVFSRKWEVGMTWSTREELKFLESATTVLPGCEIEVMQIASFKAGKPVRKSLALGGGEYIYKDEIDLAVKELDIRGTSPDTVYLIHNHYDEYEKYTLPLDSQPNDGLAVVGGLSKDDIELADSFLKNEMGGKGNVFMVAINQRGITYTYQAGTSEFRDWMNDKD